MKRYFHIGDFFFVSLILFAACQKEAFLNHVTPKTDNEEIVAEIKLTDIGCLTDNVIIGKKLENPYSLRNMKKACDDLFPATKGEVALSDTLIVPNYLYVRFLPSDSTDVNKLLESEYELYNYPLDYEIIGDPSDYYDSSVEEGKITWQYTAIPIESELPDVQYEVIDVCYIPSDTPNNNHQIVREIEDRAFINTGNGGTSNSNNGGGSSGTSTNKLRGTIRVLDTNLGYQGVKGIKVRARVFLKIRTDYTDEDGNYAITNDFNHTPRYELRFENVYGFQEGYSLNSLVLPATYNMKNSRNVDIKQKDSHKWWSLATVNNAAYDWFKFCEDNGISKPSGDLRIWLMKVAEGAATLMLHHGLFNYTNASKIMAFIALTSPNPYALLNDALLKALIQLIGPDITLCGIETVTESKKIYETICHELAHATHFQKLGNNDISRCAWWCNVFDYELEYLSDPGYGDESYNGSGPCGVTEMWAYAMGYYMQKSTYSFKSTTFPRSYSQYWFKPDALWDLLISGTITPKEAADCLVPSVKCINDFKEMLVNNNPGKKGIIESTYARY